MDDVMGSVTGTATYEKVVVESAEQGELFEVTGYYHDSTTMYRTPRLQIGGLDADGRIEGELLMEPSEEDGTVWVVAGEKVLLLHSEKPDDEGE